MIQQAKDPTGTTETLDVSNFELVGGQLGTNAGGTYKDSDGNLYYVKEQKSLTHAEKEILAFRLYEELGVNVAQMHIGLGALNGKTYTISKFISGDGSAPRKYIGDYRVIAAIQKDFVIDAWLANGDAIGDEYNNMVIDPNGDPFRIDSGGALLFIGPGDIKGNNFDDKVSELDSMLDGAINRGSANVFGLMTPAAKTVSARKLLNITPERIDEIVDANMSDPAVATVLKKRLKARREYLFKYFNIQNSSNTPPE